MSKSFILMGIFALLVLYVAVNVYISQKPKPLFFRLVSLQDASAAREFLANLEGTAYYDSQSRYLNAYFDNVFAAEVSIQQLNTTKAIAEYENLLRLNPDSRDVLIQLALLHEENGNHTQAAAYYDKAKKVDPWINMSELESLRH